MKTIISILILVSILLTSCGGEKPSLMVTHVLFNQDFEQGLSNGVFVDNGEWTLEQNESGNHYFCNKNAEYYPSFHLGSPSWTNYAFEIRVTVNAMKEEPYVMLIVRHNIENGKGGYTGSWNFKDEYFDFASQDPYRSFSQGNIQPSLDDSYLLRMEVFGENIKYYINDQLMGAAENHLYESGIVKFVVSPNLQVCVDDIYIQELTFSGDPVQVQITVEPTYGEFVPSENETSLPMDMIKPDPVVESSAILLNQDFEKGSVDGINIYAGEWTILIDSTGNHSLCNQTTDNWPTLLFGRSWWKNYAVEIRVKPVAMMSDPYMTLFDRYDLDTGAGYGASLNFLSYTYDLASSPPYENLAHGSTDPTSDNWHRLKLEVFGQNIKFYLNDLLVGDVEHSLFTQGSNKINTSPGLKICVDDVRVWQLNDEGDLIRVPDSIHPSFELVADDTVGNDSGAGNAWGAHKPRIIRTLEGVFTTYTVEGQGQFKREWRLAWRQAEDSWVILAKGDAGKDPVMLLSSPDGMLYIIGWPNETGMLWSGKPHDGQIEMTIEKIPGVAHSNWPYGAAGIDATGNLCVFSTQGAKPGIFYWSCYLTREKIWRSHKTLTDYGFRYAYVFPNPDGGLALVATRDVAWDVLGYRQPSGVVYGYVLNAFAYWRSDDVSAGLLNQVYYRENHQTEEYPYVTLNASYESYLDASGNMHILYIKNDIESNGFEQHWQAIISPEGKLLNEVRLPDEFSLYNRILQDTHGDFYILSSAGYLVPAGEYGATLGIPIAIDLQGYTVDYSGMAITAPRTGTLISDTIDVVFPTEGGTKWVYFRLDLRGQ
jgi:hypothetical protein